MSTQVDSKTLNRSMAIIGVLFFIFGFVTWLSSVLIPYLKIACQLKGFAEAYLVVFAFYISYAIMAVPSAWILSITGFKKGMMYGLLLMAAGSFLFIPAALYRTYEIFLTGLFIQGSGLAILQTAANPYVTILGPQASAAKRISIMGICNGTAGAMAPVILGAVILSDVDGLQKNIDLMSASARLAALDSLAHRVILPYAIIGTILLILAVLIYFSGLPEAGNESEEATGRENAHKTTVFQFPHLLLGAFTLFLYVGVEVIAGDTIVNFGASQGIALSTAKFFTSCTIIGMLVGYVIGIVCIPRYCSQAKALKISALCGIAFALGALCTHGYVAVSFIALLGLANSLMWPAIWPLAIDDLGKFTKSGSAMLVMAIGGGAVLPLIYGQLADKFSPHQAYWIVIPCYTVILFYAVYGHKIRTGAKRSRL